MYDAHAGRDRALDFRWAIPDSLLWVTGIPDNPDKLYDQARRSIFAAACIAADERPANPEAWWISYSRNKAFYRDQHRYQGLPYTYDRVTRAVAEGINLGLLEEDRALRGAHLAKDPRQSRLRATRALLHAFQDSPFEYQRRPCTLLVRDADGRPVTIPETQAVCRMRREVDRINAYLGGVTMTLGSGDGWDHGRWTVRARSERTGGWAAMTPEPIHQVVRIFGRGRTDKGGRLYGFWQQLPKARRAECLINGELCIEPDFARLHPTLLYAMRGHRLQHDPYETGTFPRDEGKLALNVALNAKSIPVAAAYLVEKERNWSHGLAYTHRVLKAVQKRNPLIARDIGADRGIDCMRIDSGMCLDVLKACEGAGIPALPVHDSFMVPASQEARVEGYMTEILDRTVNQLRSSRRSTNS